MNLTKNFKLKNIFQMIIKGKGLKVQKKNITSLVEVTFLFPQVKINVKLIATKNYKIQGVLIIIFELKKKLNLF